VLPRDRSVRGATRALPTTMQGLKMQEAECLGQNQGNYMKETQVEHH